MDAIFKALSDDTRRQLLDMLKEKDGQTLSELEGNLGMTRFGVMKHLKILEEASLVVTRKSGRFKYHYLNAVPLQTVIDRWIDPLVQKPLSRLVLDLKADIEGEKVMNIDTRTAKPDFVLETYIKTDASNLWAVLTKPEHVEKYHFAGVKPSAEKTKGSTVEYVLPDGESMLGFEIIDEDVGKRLEMEFFPKWEGPDMPSSRCVYELEEIGENCKLTILHFNIPAGQEDVAQGWSMMASAVKTYVETGEALAFPPMGGFDDH